MADAIPKGLSAPGKALWRAILGDLEDGWELDRRELHFLERACRAEDQLGALEAVVAKDGSTVSGSRGQTVVHPAVGEARHWRCCSSVSSVPTNGRRPPAVEHARMARRGLERR